MTPHLFEQDYRRFQHKAEAQLSEYQANLSHPDPEWAACYAEVHEQAAERHQRLLPALDHVAAAGVGATLKHREREQWMTLFPDASAPGKFRWQLYGLEGFISHGTHLTLFEAALDAAEQGFTIPDDGAPDRVFGLPSFEMGNRIAEVIRGVNSDTISWADAHNSIASIRREYDENRMSITGDPQTGEVAPG